MRQAEQRELCQDQLLRTRYFLAGALLVADDAHRPQRIWLAKDAVLARGGTPVVMAPRDLPVDLFVQWLRFHVPNAAAANLLGLEYPSDPQDALARGRYLLDAEIPAPDPLLVLMEREFPANRVAALVAKASPQQRQLLSLVQQELQQRDLLPLVEGQQPRRVHFHSLKKALARQLGVSPARISQMIAQLRKIDQHF